MNTNIFLLKLIPGIDGRILNTLASSYDGLIIESFGVGDLPNYGNGSFPNALSDSGSPPESWYAWPPRSLMKAVTWRSTR